MSSIVPSAHAAKSTLGEKKKKLVTYIPKFVSVIAFKKYYQGLMMSYINRILAVVLVSKHKTLILVVL